MAKKVKISSYLPGVHNVITQGSIPHPTTAPYLNLHIRQKEQERFLNEQERLKRRGQQIKHQMKIVNREIKRLLKSATGKEWIKGKGNPDNSIVESLETMPKSKTLIEY